LSERSLSMPLKQLNELVEVQPYAIVGWHLTPGMNGRFTRGGFCGSKRRRG